MLHRTARRPGLGNRSASPLCRRPHGNTRPGAQLAVGPMARDQRTCYHVAVLLADDHLCGHQGGLEHSRRPPCSACRWRIGRLPTRCSCEGQDKAWQQGLQQPDVDTVAWITYCCGLKACASTFTYVCSAMDRPCVLAHELLLTGSMEAPGTGTQLGTRAVYPRSAVAPDQMLKATAETDNSKMITQVILQVPAGHLAWCNPVSAWFPWCQLAYRHLKLASSS